MSTIKFTLEICLRVPTSLLTLPLTILTIPPTCRPTHLLESHVSGVLLKKETTEEGEVGPGSRYQVDIIYC